MERTIEEWREMEEGKDGEREETKRENGRMESGTRRGWSNKRREEGMEEEEEDEERDGLRDGGRSEAMLSR